MSRANPLFDAMKRAEYAFKRSEFNPANERPQQWPWYEIAVGESFFVPSYAVSTQKVRALAQARTRKSGYEFSVNKKPDGTSVTRVA